MSVVVQNVFPVPVFDVPAGHGVADVFPEYCKEPLTEAVMSNDTANRCSGVAVDAKTEALSTAQSCYADATEASTSHEIDTTNVSVS